MKDVITYKGFIGAVHFSAEDKIFHGKIEGKSVDELLKAFHEEVDDYINLCKETGKEPMRSYKGSFNVRIPPEIHKKAVEKATRMGVSLNRLVQEALEKELTHTS